AALQLECFLFLTIPPPPRPTLFPYTTLFRSVEGGLWLEDNGHTVQRNYYFINGPIDDGFFLRGPDIRQFYQTFDVKTRQLYLKRSEEHTSELQSRENLVCRLLLEKKKDHGMP